MSDAPIEEGNLLAYLYGESQPEVERALRTSPALRAELADLRRAHGRLFALVGGAARPDPQDMVDAATGTATPEQQLRVAVYARGSAAGQQELDELARLLADDTPRTKGIRLPRFIALPLTIGAVRSDDIEDVPDQTYYAAEIDAQVALQIQPPRRDRWQIEGRVTSNHQPVAGARVSLSAPERRPRPRTTDELGFFRFDQLPSGTYRLQVTLEQGMLVVPEIVLRDD